MDLPIFFILEKIFLFNFFWPAYVDVFFVVEDLDEMDDSLTQSVNDGGVLENSPGIIGSIKTRRGRPR